ncbi:MAG: NUDIX domain-containing protein [Alistipes sp.]|nr:NUDIX domain-containing protein [Alistipes sp.]
MHSKANYYTHSEHNVGIPIEADGSIRVWFAERELLFAAEPREGYYVVSAEAEGPLARAKVITFLETYNSVEILSSEPLAAFEAFARQMKWVEAAGGVVESDRGEVVMISRNGRWDLPKGHREQGESFEECAAREAEEETGVKVAEVGRLLATTLHAYNIYGEWELKLTAWYVMRALSRQLTPQREEGIVRAEWVAPDCIEEQIKNSFPTIKKVFSAFSV